MRIFRSTAFAFAAASIAILGLKTLELGSVIAALAWYALVLLIGGALLSVVWLVERRIERRRLLALEAGLQEIRASIETLRGAGRIEAAEQLSEGLVRTEASMNAARKRLGMPARNPGA